MSVKNWFSLKYPGFSLLVLSFFTLCLTLSYWQYQRSIEKQDMMSHFTLRMQLPFITVSDLKTPHADLRFYRVKLTGHFDNRHSMLLDNKTFKGQVGYELYTPFYAGELKAPILVDRGFIPQGTSRKVLPKILPIEGEQGIVGMLNHPPAYFALGRMIEEQTAENPLRIQYLALKQVSHWLGETAYPYVLLLNASDNIDLQAGIMNIPPERHKGYALQWFALAVTLLILFVVLNRAS